ncbi:MAG: VWA domain-containing protein [Phycisphaeraceae bacterium]|nr:VWA domain-containing protein [Phycisphaeraceae bacterium]
MEQRSQTGSRNSQRNQRLAVFATAGVLLIAGAAIGGGPVSNSERIAPPALNAPKPDPTDGPVVQLALLLDTSNSMDGLIDQARAQLWSVVNELASIERDCQSVQLQVAVFQYGNSSLESDDGFIQMRTPFTTDLDIISEQLFALRTNGGNEFCGQVIDAAVNRLEWIKPSDKAGAPSVTRMIVIAGNEPFTQGTTPYTSSIPSATNRGITVHTVFCGPRQEGINTFWKDGATLGEGRYCAINQSRTVVDIPTPFDEVIMRLGGELNSTYIRFGDQGREYEMRQEAQDSLSGANTRDSVSRNVAKASGLYRNSVWDLVDASREEGFSLAEIDRSTLPDDLQGLTDKELEQAIVSAAARRAEIQASINENNAARAKFIAEHQGEQTVDGTLESVLLEAIRDSFAEDNGGAGSEDGSDG